MAPRRTDSTFDRRGLTAKALGEMLAAGVLASVLGCTLGPDAGSRTPPPHVPTKHHSPRPYGGSPWGGLTHVGPVAVSGNAQFVVFASRERLAAGDTNDTVDVYRYHVESKRVELVSVRARAGKGADAFLPSISNDGRYVVFQSTDLGLIGSDPNPATGSHVFRRDMAAGTTEIVSSARGTTAAVTTDRGSFAPAISDDGQWVAFVSVTPKINNQGPLVDGKLEAVFEWSAASKDVTLVSRGRDGASAVPADQRSDQPSISRDGRFVAFESAATNLVGSLDKNGTIDVFLWDREQPEQLRLVSAGPGGKSGNGASGGPSLSRDARRIAFVSRASDLVGPDQVADAGQSYDAFVRDLMTGYTGRVSLRFVERERNPADPRDPVRLRQWLAPGSTTYAVALSPDGGTVAVETDGEMLSSHGNGAVDFRDDNEEHDVYLYWLRDDKPLPRKVEPLTVGKTVLPPQCDSCEPAWYLPDWSLNGVVMAGGVLGGSRAVAGDDALVAVMSESTALLATTRFERVWNQVYWWCNAPTSGVCEDPTVPNREIYIKYDVEFRTDPPELDPETRTYYLDPRYRLGWINLPGWYSGDFADGGVGPARFVLVTRDRYQHLYQKPAVWPTADAVAGKTAPVSFDADGVY